MDVCSPRYMVIKLVINRLWPIPIWAKQQHQQPQVAKAEHMPSVWSFLVLLAFLHLLFLLRINTSPGSADVFLTKRDKKLYSRNYLRYETTLYAIVLIQETYTNVRNCTVRIFKKHCEYNLMLNHCITSVLICMFHASSTRWFEGVSCMPPVFSHHECSNALAMFDYEALARDSENESSIYICVRKHEQFSFRAA